MMPDNAKSGRTHQIQQEGKTPKHGSKPVATWVFVPVDDGAFYHVQVRLPDGQTRDLGDMAPPLAGRLIKDLVNQGASLQPTEASA